MPSRAPGRNTKRSGTAESSGAVRREITVIGTSAGGLEALRTILADLPADYAAAIFVVQHMAPESPGNVPSIVQRTT